MTVASDVCVQLHAPSAPGKRASAADPQLVAGMLLVESIARQLEARFGRVIDRDDMIGRGNLGLLEAMSRFDPTRGVDFSAYASRRIRGAMLDGMRTEGLMPRRAYARASQEYGDALFDCDLGASELDDAVACDDVADGCNGAFIDEAASPEELVAQIEEAQAVREQLEHLPREHAELVRRCYGGEQSLQEISKALGFAPGWGSHALPLVRETLRKRLSGHHLIQAKRNASTSELPMESAHELQHGQASRVQELASPSGLPMPPREAVSSSDVSITSEVTSTGQVTPCAMGKPQGTASVAKPQGLPVQVRPRKRPGLPVQVSARRPSRRHPSARRTPPTRQRNPLMNARREVELLVVPESRSSQVYKEVLPQLLAMPPGEVRRVNLHIDRVVRTIFAVLPGVLAVRAEIAEQTPGFDLSVIDNLERYAIALNHAFVQCLTTVSPATSVRRLAPAAYRLREILHADMGTLVTRGLIDPAALSGYTGRTGYNNVAQDLQYLSTVLRRNLSRIHGRCAVELGELDRAETIAAQLRRLSDRRISYGPGGIAAPERILERAFTLLVRTYDEVRRVVQFIRPRCADAETIAPSLYAKRGAAPRRASCAVIAPTTRDQGVLN